jgi:hypothetical protein
MNSLLAELENKLYDDYRFLSEDERKQLKKEQKKDPFDTIIELVGKYDALKVLLIQEENRLEEQTLQTENKLFRYTQVLMENGMKITEARQTSKNDFEQDLLQLQERRKQVQILKAGLHSVEYLLRLQYKRFDIQERGDGIVEK